MLLGIAGMVGSGKTTLARALASRFGLQLALESVDQENPWLEPFYSSTESMQTYALHLQLQLGHVSAKNTLVYTDISTEEAAARVKGAL